MIQMITTDIPDISEEGIYILRSVGVFVSAIIGIFSLPEVIAGIGLLKKKEWARSGADIFVTRETRKFV